MQKVNAYKCDHCSKTSTNASAMFQHERKCWKNPNNKHKCFDFCKHLERQYRVSGTTRTDFNCKSKNILLYSYKAEHRGFKLEGLTRMPLECECFESMSLEEIMEKSIKP